VENFTECQKRRRYSPRIKVAFPLLAGGIVNLCGKTTDFLGVLVSGTIHALFSSKLAIAELPSGWLGMSVLLAKPAYYFASPFAF